MPQPRQYGSGAERQAACRHRRRAELAALQAAKGLIPLPSITTVPGWRRWRQVLAQVEQAVLEVHEQMQAYYDDRSDNWLESEKADEFTEKMDLVGELAGHAAECRGQID
jgi:hypothetical protein